MLLKVLLFVFLYTMVGSLLAASAIRLSSFTEKSDTKKLDSLDAVWITIFWPLCVLIFLATIWYSLLDNLMGKYITKEKVNRWHRRIKKGPGTENID